MKKSLLLLMIIPLASLAEPINASNNPNSPDYQNPSQQRMQNQMAAQQSQQQQALKQQIQQQSQQQQQQLNQEIHNNQQRLINNQPQQIPLPNTAPSAITPNKP